MNAPVTIGLVHTVPALAATFDELIRARRPGVVQSIHVCEAWLLETAMSQGVTEEVTQRLAHHVDHLMERGVAGILVTCSSLGEATESVAGRPGRAVPVLRIDQAMADRAVRHTPPGGTIAVLATVASTVGPTVRLVERSAAQQGTGITVEVDVLEDAALARRSGDQARHDALVAAAVRRWGGDARSDVVLLAQASMAAAGSSVESRVPVLSSPEPAVDHLLSVIIND